VEEKLDRLGAWLHFIGQDKAIEREIRSALHEAGIDLCDEQDASETQDRLLCFSYIDDSALETLKSHRLGRGTRTLVVGVSAGAAQAKVIWQLLSAGASDVLAWGSPTQTCRQIRAKLERWAQIRALTCGACAQMQLVGSSKIWQELLGRIVEAAYFSAVPILLAGESGTGKELLARMVQLLHSESGDRPATAAPVTVDCSTIVPELSGSELFGHERGAFTGAVSAREGAFALADRGTLFLDEIGELPPALQTQLLRVIQEGTYKRVGGNVWQKTNFRLVSATNRDLSQLVEEGKFRLDLYFRIAGWVFSIPPLRERREDILTMATHFLRSHQSGEALDFDPLVREYLINRHYPGNVRELRQLVTRMAHRHVGPGAITIGDIAEDDRPIDGEPQKAWPDQKFEDSLRAAVVMGRGLKDIAQITSETAIRIAVQSEHGNLQRAARRLGITDRALQIRRASGKIPG
jgi:transcriptional regulator with GAF, ATPase, and Fis domain